MRYIVLILILISCAPESGKEVVETETKLSLTHNYDNGWLAWEKHGLKINIGKNWKHIQSSKLGNNSILFVKSNNEFIQLHCKFINQDETKFSENLTKLQKTYSHLFKKWVFLDEKLERVENKKTYFLKFMFNNDKLNEEFVCEVYNIQINPKELLTVTLKYPENKRISAAKIFSDFSGKVKFDNKNLLSINIK